MNTLQGTILDGLIRYIRNTAHGMTAATAGLVRIAYYLVVRLMFAGVLLYTLLAWVGHASYLPAIICLFWHVVLVVGRHVVGQALAGQITTRGRDGQP